MSKSKRVNKRGNKGVGYEYQTNRPGNEQGGTPGRITKKITHKKERQIGKKVED